MPRGQPDYGLYTQTPVASGISDPGEAAARLGSINIYDRRGWTVWMDDFEAAILRWSAACSVGGTLPALSILQAWMGIQSVYLYTAAVAGAWARIEKLLPLIRLGRVGVEFFTALRIITPSYFSMFLNIHDGANISTAQLRLDNTARTATIVTPAGNIIVSTNDLPVFADFMWVPIKLVVDMDTDRYVRLLIGHREIDISAHALVPGGATTRVFIDIHIRLDGGVAGVMYSYIDNFILTQNEP